MRKLLQLFKQQCAENGTIIELEELLSLDRENWEKARDIFHRIRAKNLEAARQSEHILEAQYQFEEVCAKNLYNLSGGGAKYDADSPYWIVPTAFNLARKLNIDDQEILKIVVT